MRRLRLRRGRPALSATGRRFGLQEDGGRAASPAPPDPSTDWESTKRSRDETLRLDRLRRARLDPEQWHARPGQLGRPGIRRLSALVERLRPPPQVPDL